MFVIDVSGSNEYEPLDCESLFTFFLSRVPELDVISLSVQGIPLGLNAAQLVEQSLTVDAGDFNTLKYTGGGQAARIDNFGMGYIRRFAARDLNYHHSLRARSGFLYNYDQAPNGSREYHESQNVHSTLVIPVYSERHKDWKVRVLLHSETDNKKFCRQLTSQNEIFRRELRYLYLELMDRFETHLNPYHLDKSRVHPKAIQALQMLAEGYSTKVIASKLHLTEQGVEYHFKMLRDRLNARNRTHLVSLAYRFGLI